VAIALGATSMTDIALLAHQAGVFGAPPSDSTVRRGLDELDDRGRARIARARAKVRAHVWSLLEQREQGFPWVAVAGRVLTGWVVIDIDATLITAHSDKEGAAATFKRGWGFHPLGAWCQNTTESLAMVLRPGNAGANTAADHISVLTAAIMQLPARFRRRILIRIDGAGASHELMEAMIGLRSARRDVLFVTGWKHTPDDEAAIAALPAHAWVPAVDQDGEVQSAAQVAEITGLDHRHGDRRVHHDRRRHGDSGGDPSNPNDRTAPPKAHDPIESDIDHCQDSETGVSLVQDRRRHQDSSLHIRAISTNGRNAVLWRRRPTIDKAGGGKLVDGAGLSV
jgi:hypothetical protein